MQPQRASFACTALLGTNKAGILKPDADGYYPLVLGALDIFNSGGAFYPYDSAKQLFMESSSLMRRVANGALRGEYGHPRPQPGQSMRDFMGRVMDIFEPNVCCHIRKVSIDFTGAVKDDRGRPVIAIIGEVRPSGPMGPALKASLDNPSENVCFSIRSLTNDNMIGGVLNKNLKTIVTWDYVNEPGLHVAKKWHAPALESITEDQYFVPEHLLALQAQQNRMGMLAMESNGGLSAATALEELGWTGAEEISQEQATGDIIKAPASARW